MMQWTALSTRCAQDGGPGRGRLWDLGMLSCSSKDDLVRFDFDDDVYEHEEGKAARAEDVIRKSPDSRGSGPTSSSSSATTWATATWGATAADPSRRPTSTGMAREGARFTDFYSCNALCSPSRAGLLTGRYPHRTGVTFPIFPKDESPLVGLTRAVGKLIARMGAVDLVGGQSIADGLPASEITLARALKIAGYRTGVFGKWHLGDFPKQPQYHPSKHGFDEFAGFPAANDDWPVSFGGTTSRWSPTSASTRRSTRASSPARRWVSSRNRRARPSSCTWRTRTPTSPASRRRPSRAPRRAARTATSSRRWTGAWARS